MAYGEGNEKDLMENVPVFVSTLKINHSFLLKNLNNLKDNQDYLNEFKNEASKAVDYYTANVLRINKPMEFDGIYTNEVKDSDSTISGIFYFQAAKPILLAKEDGTFMKMRTNQNFLYLFPSNKNHKFQTKDVNFIYFNMS
jgi:hypothetical protein